MSNSSSSGNNGTAGRQAPPIDPEYASKLPLDDFIHQTLNSSPSVMANQSTFEHMFINLLSQTSPQNHQVAKTVHQSLTNDGLFGNNVDKDTAAWAIRLVYLALNNANKPPRGGGGGGYNPPVPQVGDSWATVAANSGPPPPQHQGGGERTNIYVRSFFFPSEDSFNQLANALKSAKHSIDLAIYSFTDNDLSKIITNAHRNGIKVRIISEDDQVGKMGNDIEFLRDEASAPNESLMHNKFCIVDKRFVITGSYNWSKAARRQNQENILITNSPEAVQSYCREFNKLWKQF
ncbi:hypothetical protein H4219_003261 [Mycoemilia scoparia]|uniref:Mitochondrial cardiolipin hydrolase n=1 Tax=Mycoemilia scoparia TaxID=417184 RepID=A0A9W8DN33_9FUNG|nr:hypothetical protein H4219_003261 [Mycoemilia scoparia]